jgi:hypothetical protein
MKESRCPLCGRATLIPVESPIGRALVQSPWAQGQTAGVAAPPPDVRFDRIEQAIDAIAIEVERVAESQRYAARLLSDRTSPDETQREDRRKST